MGESSSLFNAGFRFEEILHREGGVLRYPRTIGEIDDFIAEADRCRRGWRAH